MDARWQAKQQENKNLEDLGHTPIREHRCYLLQYPPSHVPLDLLCPDRGITQLHESRKRLTSDRQAFLAADQGLFELALSAPIRPTSPLQLDLIALLFDFVSIGPTRSAIARILL